MEGGLPPGCHEVTRPSSTTGMFSASSSFILALPLVTSSVGGGKEKGGKEKAGEGERKEREGRAMSFPNCYSPFTH